MNIIGIDHLTKTFRTRTGKAGLRSGIVSLIKPQYRHVNAVNDISFDVNKGEVLAFLGPNGAGKSTTIKILTGILTPGSGNVSVLGFNPQKQRKQLAYRIGTVFGQKSQLWFHLPPSESFRLLAAIYEIDMPVFHRRRDELVERFGIGDLMDVPVRKLSLGQRVRCEIAASLLHNPKLLFLDEPTIGLDVVIKQEIRRLIGELNAFHGLTIFLTSHDIGDIEKICKRAIIIHHGRIIVDESVKTLKHMTMAKKIIGIKYAKPIDLNLPGLAPTKKTELGARFDIDTRKHRLQEIIGRLVLLGDVVDLTVEDEPLEDLIADVFRSRNAEEAYDFAKR